VTTEAEIYRYLNELFSDVFLRDDLRIGPETTSGDIEGWDSIKYIEIMIAVEQHFGVQFRSREFDELRTVGDLAQKVATKLKAP
jgi:acyl carrier protein